MLIESTPEWLENIMLVIDRGGDDRSGAARCVMSRPVQLIAFLVVLLLSVHTPGAKFMGLVSSSGPGGEIGVAIVLQAASFYLLFVLLAIVAYRTGLFVLAFGLCAFALLTSLLHALTSTGWSPAELVARLTGVLAATGAMAIQSKRSDHALVHPPLTSRSHEH